MSSKIFKYFLKSKSISFARDLKDKSHKLNSTTWNKHKVHYRASTSDMTLIYEILFQSKYQSEYLFPEEIKPNIIFDIGGNIGITSIYLSSLYPNSKIFVFEPLTENYEILLKNIKPYQNIKAFNIGLGSKNGKFKAYLSDDSENFGGVSLYPNPQGNRIEEFVMCEVKNINEIVKENNIDKIDLIKIDTEGAEHDILLSLDEKILINASWIGGELHGNRDFELLDYLEKLGFSIALRKEIDNRLFMFSAAKKDVVSMLSRKIIKAL